MATPGLNYFPETGDLAVDSLTTGYYWQLRADRTIDWAISNGAGGEFWYNPAAVADAASAMLSVYSLYANVRFNYVGYYTTPQVAASAGSELTFSLSASTAMFPSSSIWARAFFPRSTPTFYSGDAGDVFLNVNSFANFLPSYAPGSAGWALFMHEIGHALGLKHPHDDGGTGRPTWQEAGLGVPDVDWLSIMSYNDDFNWNLRGWDPATPMILDVLALQYMYGKNMSTNAGDTVLELSRTNAYSTLWDADGFDTLTANGSSEGWLIVLPNILPSTLVDTRIGFAAPMADENLPSPTTLFWLAGDLENAVGSEYSDQLYGSDGRNYLRGLGGNDSIDGGAGIDTAFYSGQWNQYEVVRTSEGITLIGPDGTDSLRNVERLRIGGATNVALDIEGNAGQAYRLYQAAFDRVPDIGGLGYQMNDLDNGWELLWVANNFIASPEFQTTYGPLNDVQFVRQLYLNVLNREPEAAGWAYHVDRINSGAPRSAILLGFSESPENKANVIGAIEHGMIYTI